MLVNRPLRMAISRMTGKTVVRLPKDSNSLISKWRKWTRKTKSEVEKYQNFIIGVSKLEGVFTLRSQFQPCKSFQLSWQMFSFEDSTVGHLVAQIEKQQQQHGNNQHAEITLGVSGISLGLLRFLSFDEIVVNIDYTWELVYLAH